MAFADRATTDAVISTAYRLARRRWVSDEATVQRLLDECDRRPEVLKEAIRFAPYPVVATRSTPASRAKATELLRRALAIAEAEERAGRRD